MKEQEIKVVEARPMFSPRSLSRFLDVNVKTFNRARRAGRIPPPDLYFGNHPRWSWETVQAIKDSGRI